MFSFTHVLFGRCPDSRAPVNEAILKDIGKHNQYQSPVILTAIRRPSVKSFLPESSFGLRVLLPAPGCVPVCVRQLEPQGDLRQNSSPIQARIIKYGPGVQTSLVKIPLVFGGDWHLPSRSTLKWKSKFHYTRFHRRSKYITTKENT